MSENMFCKTQKASSKEYRDNFDRIFKQRKEDLPRAIRKVLYLETKGVDINFAPVAKFIPKTTVICEFCNFPILMESFEWDSELKRCDNCKSYNELRKAK